MVYRWSFEIKPRWSMASKQAGTRSILLAGRGWMGTAGAGAGNGQATRAAAARLGRRGCVIARPMAQAGVSQTVGCSGRGAGQGGAGEGLRHIKHSARRGRWMRYEGFPEPTLEKINKTISNKSNYLETTSASRGSAGFISRRSSRVSSSPSRRLTMTSP